MSQKKYTVYDNDLKFKNLRKIDPDNVLWNHEDVKNNYFEKDFDTIKYRLKECYKNNFSYLDLSHLGLSKIPDLSKWKYFDYLKSTKFLFLNNNKLSKITHNDIFCFSKLEVLDVSSNDIEKVEFLPVTLKEFVCHNNKLGELLSHDSIEKLDCSDNNICKLSKYPSLVDLLCYNNNLANISEYKKLTRLVCKNNPLEILAKQPSLIYLDCSTTKLTGKITDIPSVQYLICNYTKINDVSNFCFLETLEIIETDITKLPYIKTLKDLLFKNSQEIQLPSSYKALEYVKEHDNSYIRFDGI
jgi:hypothetical protein